MTMPAWVRRPLVVSLVSLITILIVSTAGHSRQGRPGSAIDYVSGLRTGRWIQLEGATQGPSSVSCTQVGQLAGDFLDDDWALRGAVRAIDAAKREFSIGGCRVRTTENTAFDNPKGVFRGFADLREGMLVEVDGTFLQSRVLLADEVDDESEELVEEPKLRNQVAVVGRIERIDPRKRVVTVMGFEFHLTEKTRLRSVID